MCKGLLAVLGALLLAACGKAPEAPRAAGERTIFVSIAPQARMVERLAGPGTRVEVLVPPGKSPHTYEPSPRQLAELGQATAFVTVGVPFEEQVLPRIRQAYPELPVVDSIAGIERQPIEGHHHDDDEDGAEEHHHDDEAGLDPHVWLAPPLLRKMAANVAAGVHRIDPAGKAEYDANLAAYLADVDAVDRQLRDQLAPLAGRHVYVFHPAFGYFAAAYGLHQEAVEVGGKAPTPRQLQELIAAARAEHVRVIFVQPQFDRRSAAAVAAAIDGAVVPLDPLARDVLANLRDMGAAIHAALAEETP